jgi:glycosyltransferase involved in cell wall biosynthesis
LAGNIHRTGYVVNVDLPAIYSLSKMFLYPSLRESFGIPLLEAMRCETPVITSNTSAMQEVTGDAAYFIDPTNPRKIAKAIFDIINNNILKSDLIKKGYNRSKEFNWQQTSKNVLNLYNSIKI